ncbi:hypothetical protein [Psychromonas antarctica]|uniref:hypothetical protein n=1 Tax=Psychromonas antarctica TaxID=67573 RepID=UPI001EE7A32E|nr:hypothetical protein [Psychromonas antarctica]MCG6201261.1 hypothetical protein [Psychromonas antarctica]
MKKVLIIATVAAVGAGAYVFNQQQSASTAYNVLDYVPADTPLFTAQLTPFPLKDYLSSASAEINSSDQLIDDLSTQENPKIKFFLNILKTYQDGLKDPDALIKTFGFPEQLRAYFYTLGLLPVLKAEIENPQAIWDLLDKNELESGFTHQQGSLQSLSYRSYPLTDENNPEKIELIIAIDKGLLTITLNSAYNDQALLATALGLSKVENSLAASGQIEEIIATHSFQKASVGFINHIELFKGLTTTDGNQLARQIAAIEKHSNKPSPLASIRNAQCVSDFATITTNWPRTVFGYTTLDISAEQSTVAISTVIESKNQVLINALKSLRGYIPEYTADIKNNVFAMGLGLDINQLGVALNDIWSDLQTPSYTCQPLAQLQQQISQSGESIGMIGMSANMASGVKGISMAVLDYTISQPKNDPMLESLDALLTLSADNPEQIFNSAKMFIPALQSVQLNSSSEAIDLGAIFPMPAQLKIDPKLAIKGNHLVIYNGEKGKKVADSLATEALAKNGMYSVSFATKKMFTPIVTAMELANETLPEEAMFLIDYDARMKMSVDINEQGIVFSNYINSKASK